MAPSYSVSTQDAKDKEIARLKSELAKAKVLHTQAQKQLETISRLHQTQAITIAAQSDTIRQQIRLHPEDMHDIQDRTRKAEEQRLRIVEQSDVKRVSTG